MTIKTKHKRILTITLVAFAFVILIVSLLTILPYWHRRVYIMGHIEVTAKEFDRAVVGPYIQASQGSFPVSEADLIRQGFIKRTKVDSEYEYFLKLGPSHLGEQAYYKRPYFKLLEISYGAMLENIERHGDKLLDKVSGQEVLLIDGPYGGALRRKCYERLSLEWYDLMLREKRTHETSSEHPP